MTSPEDYFLTFETALSHITSRKIPGRNMGGYVDFLFTPFLISVIDDLLIIYHFGPGKYEQVTKNIQVYSLLTKKDLFSKYYLHLFFSYLPSLGAELVIPDVTMPSLHIFSPWRFAFQYSSYIKPGATPEPITCLVRLLDGSRCLLTCRTKHHFKPTPKNHFFRFFTYAPLPTSLIFTEYPVATRTLDDRLSIHFPTPRKLRDKERQIQPLPSLEVVYGYRFALAEPLRDTSKSWFLVMKDGEPLMVEQRAYCILGVYFSYDEKCGQTLKKFVPIPLTYENREDTRGSTSNTPGKPRPVHPLRKNSREKGTSARKHTSNPPE